VDVQDFLDILARRMGMLKRGGVVDQPRAAQWFIHWWREQGSLATATAPLASFGAPGDVQTHRRGWSFDFEWSVDQAELPHYGQEMVQQKMEQVIDAFEAEAQDEEAEGGGVSSTQEKKKQREILMAKRAARTKARSPAGRRTG
jgi:mitochondrial GTPase 1